MTILQQLGEYLAIGSFQRALIAGSFVAITCALLGVFLVLRRHAMIGHGLAHVGFGAIGLGLLLHAAPAYATLLGWLHLDFLLGHSPLYIMVPLVMLSSLWILQLAERAQVHGDAAIGLVSSLGVALGILLASLGGGFNVDLNSYLFGSVIAISREEVLMSVVLCLLVIAVVVLFFHDLLAVTFDEEYARVLGIRTERITKILVLCTGLTIGLGIRIVGTLLVSALIVFPAVTALQMVKGFRAAVVVAAAVALASVVVGILLALIFNFPPGATTVLVNFGFFAAAYVVGRFRR